MRTRATMGVMNQLRYFFAIMVALTVFGGGFAATAQEADPRALFKRIEALRKDVSDLQSVVYGGKAPPPAGTVAASAAPGDAERTARLEVRLSEVEDQMRALTGEVERVAHDISQVAERLDKLVADVDFRLTEIEKAQRAALAAQAAPARPAAAPAASAAAAPGPLAPGASGAAQPPASSAGTTSAALTTPALPPGTPEEQYKYAYDLLRRADYAEAERAFKAFVEAHADHKLASNAFYWLAETYYVRGDYGQAATYFARGYQDYPDSVKAPDNLLKLAMSLARLDRKKDACVTFEELAARFPTASQAIKRRAASERKRAGCS